MYQCVGNLMLPRYCRNRFLSPHRLHYYLVSLLLCPSTRFGHLSSLSTSPLGTPGLWKLPRCGTGEKIDQRKQSFFLSFFHSFPHRLENSAQWTNPQPGCPRRVFHSSHSPSYSYPIQPIPCSFCPEYLLLIHCSESGGTRQLFTLHSSLFTSAALQPENKIPNDHYCAQYHDHDVLARQP